MMERKGDKEFSELSLQCKKIFYWIATYLQRQFENGVLVTIHKASNFLHVSVGRRATIVIRWGDNTCTVQTMLENKTVPKSVTTRYAVCNCDAVDMLASAIENMVIGDRDAMEFIAEKSKL